MELRRKLWAESKFWGYVYINNSVLDCPGKEYKTEYKVKVRVLGKKTLKIPAKEKELENEVRGKRLKKKRTKIFVVLKERDIFKEGVVNISYAVKCYKKSIY